MQIFAGTSGLLDDVPVAKVREFAAGFAEAMRAEHGALMTELDGWKAKWTDETAATVKAACLKFKQSFVG